MPRPTPKPTAHSLPCDASAALHGEVIRFLMVRRSLINTVFSSIAPSLYVFIYPVEFFFSHNFAAPPSPPSPTTCRCAVSHRQRSRVAFLAYKWFVFRTHGNYFKEWLKVFAVYGVSLPFPVIVIPVATSFFLWLHFTPRLVSLLALIANSAVIACYSYFAHKKFSFKR